MLKEKIKVTFKELWAMAPKLQTTLKEILTSKHLNKNESKENKD